MSSKCLIIYSTKRSTHHAFLEGLLKGESYQYFNDCGFRGSEFRYVEEVRAENCSDFDTVVYSFEKNYSIDALEKTDFFKRNILKASSLKRCVFLRDPLNMAASTYKIWSKFKDTRTIEWYFANLYQFSRVVDFCYSDQSFKDYELVYANKFWSDCQYQDEAIENLGMAGAEFDNKLSHFGGGGNSFFDNSDNLIKPEALMSRFESLSDDEFFIDSLREPSFFSSCVKFSELVGDEVLEKKLRSF